MRFIIAVDLEGVACVVGSPHKTLAESPDLLFACRQATKEANAAAKALFDSGATQVIVWDNHGKSLNLLYDELDERCDIITGVGTEHRWPELDRSFNGVLMIGYHAMDNTSDGVLAHTYSSVVYQWMRINGTFVGEIAIDGAMAGDMGVPVIFVSSDEKGTQEAKRFMPWVETLSTKKGLGRNMALCKHPKRVEDEIYQGTMKTVQQLPQMKPFVFSQPLSIEYRFKRMESAENIVRSQNGWILTDPHTVEQSFEKLSECF